MALGGMQDFFILDERGARKGYAGLKKKRVNYYPFGMLMPGRHYSNGDLNYRYGFQGQEVDNEIKGDGNSVSYKYRMHDPRLGRFFAVDPLAWKYPHYTPYSFSGNKVINHVELEGLEEAGKYLTPQWDFTDETNPANPFKSTSAERIAVYQGQAFGVVAGFAGWLAIEGGIAGVEAGIASQLITYLGSLSSSAAVVVTRYGDRLVLAIGEYGDEGINFVYGFVDESGVDLVPSDHPGAAMLTKQLRRVLRRLIKYEPCGCFTEKTLVNTNKGLVPISEVLVGDSVWAYSDSTGLQEFKPVIETFAKEWNEIYIITAGEITIEATHEHPFFVSGKWIKVDELSVGDSLTLANGESVVVSKINHKKGDFMVYNLLIEDFHTYFVSEERILVHNGNPCATAFQSKAGIFGADWISKKIHADVYSKKGKELGEVSFRLSKDLKSIVVNSVFSNKNSAEAVEQGEKFIGKPENRKKLLELAKDGLNSANSTPDDKKELEIIINILSNE